MFVVAKYDYMHVYYCKTFIASKTKGNVLKVTNETHEVPATKTDEGNVHEFLYLYK